MSASLKFYADTTKSTPAAADLSDAKVAVYNDGVNDYEVKFYSAYTNSGSNTPATGINGAKVFVYTSGTSIYVVDGTSNITFKYEDSADSTKNYSISMGTAANIANLMKLVGSGSHAEIVGKLLDVAGTSGKSVLQEKVATQPVVEAIFDAQDGGATPKNIAETKLGSKFIQKSGGNVDKDFAGKVLDAKEGKKSVLVETLGGLLDTSDAVYGAGNNETAKGFLGDKGMKGQDGVSPQASDVAAIPALQTAVTSALKGDSTFQQAIKGQDGVSPQASDIAAVPALQTAVTSALKGDSTFQQAIKGQDGVSPQASDVAAVPALQTAVTSALKGDSTFQQAIKGQDGVSPQASDVAAVPALQTAVTSALKGDSTFQQAIKSQDGEQGPKPSAKDIADALKDPAGVVDVANAVLGAKNKDGRSVLQEKVATQSVVEAIFDAQDSGAKISETKLGGTFARQADLLKNGDSPIKTVDDLIAALTSGNDKTKKVYTEKGADDKFALIVKPVSSSQTPSDDNEQESSSLTPEISDYPIPGDVSGGF